MCRGEPGRDGGPLGHCVSRPQVSRFIGPEVEHEPVSTGGVPPLSSELQPLVRMGMNIKEI